MKLFRKKERDCICSEPKGSEQIQETGIRKSYNPDKQKPLLRCSICNGEQVAGFKDLASGHFEEVMLIRNREDLDTFREKYGITGEIGKVY